MEKRITILAVIVIAFSLLYWGCEDYTEDFPVPPASTVADFYLVALNQFVPPDTITFYNRSIVPERAGTPMFYWDFGDGETYETTDTVAFTHVYDTIGKFEISLTIKTSAGDSAFASDRIIMKDLLLGDTTFYETFEDKTVIPDIWVLVNVDGNTPSSESISALKDSAWIISFSSYFKSNVALGVSYYDPEAAADDWMITPSISLGTEPVLEWHAMSMTTSGDYPDSYEVYVSTTTQDIPGCEANGVVERITDEQWGVDSSNPGEGIAVRRLDLSNFANQDVYIAFRLMTPYPGGDRLSIDNILVVNKN